MPDPEEIRAWENEPAATEDDSYGQGCANDSGGTSSFGTHVSAGGGVGGSSAADPDPEDEQ